MTENEHSPTDPPRFNTAVRLLAHSALAVAFLLGATLSCGGAVEGEFEGDEPVGTTSQPITLAGYPLSSPVLWDGPQSLGSVSDATGNPVVTSGCAASYVVFTRVAPSGRYKG